MPGRGRPRALLVVSEEDREVLVRWSKRPRTPHSIAQRARIVLLAAEGLSNNEVADKVGCNQATVVKWRKRFIERGLDGLADDPRPGAPRSISDADVEALIVRTLEESSGNDCRSGRSVNECWPSMADWARARRDRRGSVVSWSAAKRRRL